MASAFRHRADALPAAVVTLGTALAILPFAIALPPLVLVAIWLASTFARSLAPVHQHCHAHYAVFGLRALDATYDAILMLAAGNTTAVWELQHVRGHHQRYLERASDPANNHRFGGGRLCFTILGDALSIRDSFAIARDDRRARARLARQVVLQLVALAGFVAIDPLLALAFIVAPWLLLRWAVFYISYSQHADVPMTNVYDGSVTHFGWSNRLWLNVGHHTAHHEKPTLHWTRLPDRTAAIVERIPDACLR